MFTETQIFGNDTLIKIGQILIAAVVMLIVSIPEGLPLAVSIAMAMSIKNLKEDEIIVKNLEAVQACAQLNDLFVGKTGTLTKGNLKVKMIQISDQNEEEQVDQDENILERISKNYAPHVVDDIAQNIISITDVRLEACPIEAIYKPQGSPVEAGMVKFILENDYRINGKDVARLMKYRNSHETRKLVCLPFDQALKRKIVIRQNPENDELARIYVQGAPESIFDLSKFKYNAQDPMNPTPLSRQDIEIIQNQIINDRMAK